MADSNTTPSSNQDDESSAGAIDVTDKGEAHKTSSNPMSSGADSLVVHNVSIPMPNTVGNIITTTRESGNLEDYSNRSIKSEPGIVTEPTCSMWGTSTAYHVTSIDSTELANMQQYLQYPAYGTRFDQPNQQTYENARCSSQEAVATTNAEDPMLPREVGADMDDINNPFYTVPNYPNMFINQQSAYSSVPYGDTTQKQAQGSQALPPYYESVKKVCETKCIDEANAASGRPKLEHDTDGVTMQTKKVIVPAGETHEDKYMQYIASKCNKFKYSEHDYLHFKLSSFNNMVQDI